MNDFKNSGHDKLTQSRLRMVREQIEERGVADSSVIRAMSSVPRHLFVSHTLLNDAYKDGPLEIGEGQTISQPYVVASMTAHLHLNRESKVLEIGTGSGYQTAVLAEIVKYVFSIERIGSLLASANHLFSTLGYENIRTRLGDGSEGWPEEAPFDGIMVTAAAGSVPKKLSAQLTIGGVMVIPLELEAGNQELVRITRTASGYEQQTLYPVRFVPLLGESEN